MNISELTALNSCKASDFEIKRPLGTGQNGLVVAAKCRKEGLPHPDKTYAVKLLFNFTHEYTSVVRNAYENEWLILSRLFPHENIVRFWGQFISPIPDGFVKLLDPETQKHCTKKNRSGQVVATKGQFLVLDYHPHNLKEWMSAFPHQLEYETVLNFTEQLMEGILYLESNNVCHLDLKLNNILVTEEEKIVLCDFGCAVQFEDSSLILPFVRTSLPGGNKAHLAPEILNTHHRFKRGSARSRGVLDYSKQASFAVGVLIHEMATGDHPLIDYPLGHTTDESIEYILQDIPPLPSSFPNSFCSIMLDLLNPDPNKRLKLSEALTQLRVCCIKKTRENSTASSSLLQINLERVKRERDIAKVWGGGVI